MEAIYSDRYPKLHVAVCILIFSLPAFAVIVNHGASTPFFFLFVLGFASLPWVLKGIRLERHEKILLLLFFAYFAAGMLSWALAGFNEAGFFYAKRAARFAVFIPVYFMVRRLDPDLRWLAYGFIFGAIAAGVWALLHRMIGFDIPHGMRASGATHPILFGNVSLIMGIMAAAMWRIDSSKMYRALVIAALVLGLIASLLSASRGGWIALPALTVIMLWYFWGELSKAGRLAIVSVLLLLPVVLYTVPSTGIKQRVNDAISDVQRYQADDSMNNSLGERFAMWKAGWLIFKDSPLTGAGLGNFIPRAHELMAQQKVSEFNRNHFHAHNIYITSLAQQGLIGVLMLMAVLLYPLWLFIRQLRSGDGQVRALALAGVCFIVGYMHFGLSEAVFTRSLTTIFYVFVVIVMLSMISARLDVQQRASREV